MENNTLTRIDFIEKLKIASPDERLVIGALLEHLAFYAIRRPDSPLNRGGNIVGCHPLELNLKLGKRKLTAICEELVEQRIFQRQLESKALETGNAPKSKDNWYSFSYEVLKEKRYNSDFWIHLAECVEEFSLSELANQSYLRKPPSRVLYLAEGINKIMSALYDV